MKARIFCKTTNKNEQSFYMKANGKEYFLFKQTYRNSNKKVFAKGVLIDDLKKISKHHSTSVRAVVKKLPYYLHYIENEYGITIYNKTEQKQKLQKVKVSYKRTPFIWQQFCWEIV
ncbi:MAG: hypothetical protein E7348_03830 [Clostridiales bacterium]|nr:hypothetical protein [Clostridiales bacterium]